MLPANSVRMLKIILAMLALFSMCASASYAATLLSTIGNPVTLQTTIFRSNVNPTFDFQTDATGGTVTSIVFQMNATSNAGSGYPDSIATTVQIQILQGASVVDTFVHGSYDAGTKQVTLTGSAALAGNTTYTIKLGCTTCANTGFDQTSTNATGWQFTSDYFGTGYPVISLGGTAADAIAPRIASLTRQNPATSPTADDAVTWRVTFDESVQNVDAADFTATGTTATVSVSQVNASTYDVTLSGGDLANLNGTVTLGFASGQNIQDLAGNALANTTPTGTNNNTFVMANDTTSPTVQIQNAPASLSSLSAFSVTFQFSETVTGFALGDVSVGNGSASNFVAVDGDTYTADVTPSSAGDVTIDVAAGAAQDTASNPNAAATQVTVTCGVGCGETATIQATQRSIQRFAAQRIRNMTSESPGISGLLDGGGFGGGFNHIGGGPVGLNYAGEEGNHAVSFSSSLQQFARFVNSMNSAEAGIEAVNPVRSPVNVWIKGRWTHAKDDRGGIDEKSDFGIVYLGADYRFSDDLLVGVLGQVDWADQKSTGLGIEAEGRGWMVGPYMVRRLSKTALMDLRLAWGKSDNKINPVGTYWDNYDSERWQVEGNLTGSYEKGNWHIAPALGLNYFKETQEAYTDSNGFSIGEQTVELGTLTFGPTLTYRMQSNDGLKLRPFMGIQGVWDFRAPDIFDVNGIATGTEDLRGKVKLGLNLLNGRGMTFLLTYSYDGIGLSDYESQTGELVVNIPLAAQGLPKGSTLRGFYSLQDISSLISENLQQTKLELSIPFN